MLSNTLMLILKRNGKMLLSSAGRYDESGNRLFLLLLQSLAKKQRNCLSLWYWIGNLNWVDRLFRWWNWQPRITVASFTLGTVLVNQSLSVLMKSPMILTAMQSFSMPLVWSKQLCHLVPWYTWVHLPTICRGLVSLYASTILSEGVLCSMFYLTQMGRICMLLWRAK